MNNLINSGRVKSDGRRLIGSPSARAYIPTGLAPFSPKPPPPTRHARRLPESQSFDGRLESIELVELLYASGQKPLRLDIIRDIETWSGLSSQSFRTGGPLNNEAFTTLANNLRVLCLTLSHDSAEPDSHFLSQFLQKVMRLKVLELELPWTNDGELYRLNSVFNPIEAWIRPTITNLMLNRIYSRYHHLSRLLLFNLQNLKHLYLREIVLLDGCWEDIIEGLRQIVPLDSCKFDLGHYFAKVTDYSLDPTVSSDDKKSQFLAANSEYVLKGGTHPRAPMYVPSRIFLEDVKYWKRLRGEFEEEESPSSPSGVIEAFVCSNHLQETNEDTEMINLAT